MLGVWSFGFWMLVGASGGTGIVTDKVVVAVVVVVVVVVVAAGVGVAVAVAAAAAGFGGAAAACTAVGPSVLLRGGHLQALWNS